MPRGLFERIVAGSEIRYFSDVFRYAVLYERGGLWMDSDMILLRPFPFRGDHFFNLQWRSGAKKEYFVCGNVGRHLRALYEAAIERFFAKSTIYKAIKTRRLLARKLDTGHYAVDLAELRRVFPSTRPVATWTGAAATEQKGFTFPVWDVG